MLNLLRSEKEKFNLIAEDEAHHTLAGAGTTKIKYILKEDIKNYCLKKKCHTNIIYNKKNMG